MTLLNHTRFTHSNAYISAALVYVVGVAAGHLVTRHTANALLLFAVALPLIILGYRAVRNRSLGTAEAEARGKEAEARQADQEDELRDALRDTDRFHAAAINREGRIIELKAEVNELCKQLSEPQPYHPEVQTTATQP